MKQWDIRGVTVDLADSSPHPVVVREPDPSPRALVDQFPAIFWTTDCKLRFTSSLGQGLARMGLGPNQMVGTTVSELFEADAPSSPAISAHERALRGLSGGFWLDWDGREFRCRVAPLRDGSTEVIGTICVAVEECSEDELADVEFVAQAT